MRPYRTIAFTPPFEKDAFSFSQPFQKARQAISGLVARARQPALTQEMRAAFPARLPTQLLHPPAQIPPTAQFPAALTKTLPVPHLQPTPGGTSQVFTPMSAAEAAAHTPTFGENALKQHQASMAQPVGRGRAALEMPAVPEAFTSGMKLPRASQRGAAGLGDVILQDPRMQKLVTQDPKIKKFMATASPSERDALAHMLMQQHGGDINMYTARKALADPYTPGLGEYLKTGSSKYAAQYHLNPSALMPGSRRPLLQAVTDSEASNFYVNPLSGLMSNRVPFFEERTVPIEAYRAEPIQSLYYPKQASDSGAWQRSEGKNPEGGLNAKGRASLRAQGHDIKPGVKGPANTPEKMKRKGSFLSRMFGPGAPGSMKKDNGEPSRRALSAKAWGEPVPQDDAGRARLYAKGQALLKRYEGKKEASIEDAAIDATLAHFGLAKHAALPPEALRQIRALYIDQGIRSGALRGALLGGLAGTALADEGEGLKGGLRGAALGGIGGGILGAAHGRYLTREGNPLLERLAFPSTGEENYFLKRPGRFLPEFLMGVPAGAKPKLRLSPDRSDFANDVLDVMHRARQPVPIEVIPR